MYIFSKAKLIFSFVLGGGIPAWLVLSILTGFRPASPHLSKIIFYRWPPPPLIREAGSFPLHNEPGLIVGRQRTKAGKEWRNFLLADKQLLLVATDGKSIFTLPCPSNGVDLHDTKKPPAKNLKRAFLFGDSKLKISSLRNYTTVFQVRRLYAHCSGSIKMLGPYPNEKN